MLLRRAGLIGGKDVIRIVFEAAFMPAADGTATHLQTRHFSVRDFIGKNSKEPSYVASVAMSTPDATAGGLTVALGVINLGPVKKAETLDLSDPFRFGSNLMPWLRISKASKEALHADISANRATPGREYMPVTLTLTLTEAQDGNQFLVKLGEFLDGVKTDTAKELAKVILPKEREAAAEAAEADAEKLRTAEESAWIALLEARSAKAAAEKKPETTAAEQAVLDAKVEQAERAWERADRLLRAAGLSAQGSRTGDAGRALRSLDTQRDKIVGGKPAKPGMWPWQVALLEFGPGPEADRQFCGGSLIAPTWVLTAAHCLPGLTANSLYIRAGATDLDKTGHGSSAGLRNVKRIIRHKYDPKTLVNDIALLELTLPAGEADGAHPATLPKMDQEPQLTAPGEIVIVTGWGRTSEGGDASSKLLQVPVPVVGNSSCKASYANMGAAFTITDQMICAGKQGKDSCQGDSGGPLVAATTGGHVQVGIVSKGYGCAFDFHSYSVDFFQDAGAAKSSLSKAAHDSVAALQSQLTAYARQIGQTRQHTTWMQAASSAEFLAIDRALTQSKKVVAGEYVRATRAKNRPLAEEALATFEEMRLVDKAIYHHYDNYTPESYRSIFQNSQGGAALAWVLNRFGDHGLEPCCRLQPGAGSDEGRLPVGPRPDERAGEDSF